MSIAIFTSGGDCAGMNPAIKHFVDYCFHSGIKPYFIYDGFEGLIDGNIKLAKYSDVAGIMHEGGTILRSSRSKRFYEYNYRKLAYENLKKHEIDKLIVLGGDGTFRGLKKFYEDFNIPFIGIPATIDNDIFATDYCIGVDSALNIIRIATDSIRDTSASFKRGFVIETMGRECGYLALITAIICGAEVCIIPELKYDLLSLQKKLKKEIKNGRQYIICVVSEATGQTQNVVNWLENDVGIETKATVLGHIQRGGNPTVYDRLIATEFITYAIDEIKQKSFRSGSIIVKQVSEFKFVPVDYVCSGIYQIRPHLLDMAKPMTQ